MVIFQKPSKSVLIIDRKFKVEAERMFSDVGIKVVSGHREEKVFFTICIVCLPGSPEKKTNKIIIINKTKQKQ